jgi:hypothetical protein
MARGKIGELDGSTSPSQRRCSLRVSVVDQYLMTVFDKMTAKACPIWPRPTTPIRLMTNSAGPEGSLVLAVNAVMRLLAGRKAAMRLSWLVDSRE